MDQFHQNLDNKSNCIGDEYIKYQKIYYKNAMLDGKVLVFLTGFCLGMVFFYFSGIKLIGEDTFPSVLSAEHIAKLYDFDFYSTGLLEYVTYKRLGQLVFMIICATSLLRGMFSYLILGGVGFELGIMMFTSIYQYGLKGLLLSVMLLVPQGLFYFMVFLLLFYKYWPGNKNEYHNYNTITENKLHNKFTKIKKIIIIFVLWMIGILSEVYINPEIIKKISVLFK